MDKKLTLTDTLSTTFEVAFPEDEKNLSLSKYVWSCNSRYKHYTIPTHCFGFYDWFCHDFSLNGKARKLYGTVRSIARAVNSSGKLDPAKCSFFFKNNCPCYGDGRYYDDIRITDENGDVLYNVCPKDPYGKVKLYFEGHGFESDTDGLTFGSMRELVNWFKKAA